MAGEVEISLRGPQAYGFARDVIAVMERHKVWPTALNFELWTHYVGDPASALGQAIERLVDAGETITEAMAESLAAEFLPRARLTDELRVTGDHLNRQLESITEAIQTAQHSNAAYGHTLAGATTGFEQTLDPSTLKEMVVGLATATRTVQRQNTSLEIRLQTSSEEVVRLHEHLEQVRREAMTDALTALANRKAFDEGLDRACAEAEQSKEPLTLAVIDIDHFKRFNDTWGHQTGDQVIRYVASVIGRVGQPPRLAARFGGEEFAVVFPGATTMGVINDMEKARFEIGSRALKRRSTNEDLGAVTVSIGLAEYRAGEAAASLLERADGALYTSKRSGRDRVTIAAAEATAAPIPRPAESGRAA